MEIFNSIETLIAEVQKRGYIIDRDLATTVYLSYHLNKPLLLEGPAGVGKTEIANVLSSIFETELIRLQCYEGIDQNQCLFDWDFKKQLLYIEANKGGNQWNSIETNIYSEKFLLYRPILKSIMSEKKSVLLIDEIDKSDEEFEPLLLEVLSEFQVSIPEIGTIKAKQTPFVILTSNNMRDLTDALKRRCCYFFIDYPSLERELKIVYSRVPEVDDLLATKVVSFIHMIRKENLKKLPSISESIDWVRALVKLEAKNLDKELVKNTLNMLLKTKNDLELIEGKLDKFLSDLPKKAISIDREDLVSDSSYGSSNSNILDDGKVWEF